jgi:hypothetical protein
MVFVVTEAHDGQVVLLTAKHLAYS